MLIVVSRLIYEQQYVVTFAHDLQTKRVLNESWRNANGQLERCGDLPAVVGYSTDSGEPILRVWYSNGIKHREAGPAFEKIAPGSGIVVSEAWYRMGRLHRNGDLPARIFRSSETGKIVQEAFAEDGLIGRSVGPAVIKYDAMTGHIVRRENWHQGSRLSRGKAPLISP